MKTKNRTKSVFLLFFITFLSLFIIIAPQVKAEGAVNENQVELAGLLGPHYKLTASDFTIPLAQVKHMDLMALSKASDYDVLNQQTSTDGIKVIENDVVESPGAYKVEFGLVQDEQVKKEIMVTVYKDEEPSPGSPTKPIPKPISHQTGNQLITTENKHSGKDMPLTGENSGPYAAFGIVILVIAIVVYSWEKKGRKKNKE
ncbi:hypothetical protein OfM1_16890 [Lactovum odontotermitis]